MYNIIFFLYLLFNWVIIERYLRILFFQIRIGIDVYDDSVNIQSVLVYR